MIGIRKYAWVIAGLIAVVASVPARAALLGVVGATPDVTLGQGVTMFYDRNGIDNSTGLLRVISLNSTLFKSAGQTVGTQTYTGGLDTLADVMLSFAINNTTGALVSNTTYNKVSIGFGNASVAGNAFGFSWQGNIDQFGWAVDGKQFDARWTMTSDAYEAIPTTNGYDTYFTNGALTARTGNTGGLIVNNTGAVNKGTATNIWAFDWVRGAGVALDGSYQSYVPTALTSGLSNSVDKLNSAVLADVFVPLPAAGWLMLSALVSLAPTVRRRLPAS